ncbi:MAG: outer membrane beta-barrel protein, partial [Bacteroidota bacterium]
WDSIASQLGGRRRRSLIIITLATAATIALAITLGLYYFGPELPDESGIAETIENRTIDSTHDQKAKTDSMQDPVSGTEGERETLEEKVVRAMDEIADEPDHGIAMAEVHQQNEISESEEPEKIQLELEPVVPQEQYMVGDELLDQEERRTDDQAKEPPVDLTPDPPADLTLDPPVDLTLDPGDEILSDPIPEFQEEQQRDPRWIVGAALSPLYSFRDAQAYAMASAAEFESGMVAYAGGVHVSYKTASRLSIESGIFYNKMGISIGAPGIQLFNNSFDFSPLSQAANQTDVTTVTNSVGNIVAKSGDVFVNNYKLNATSEASAYADPGNLSAIDAEEGIHQHLDYLELPFNLRYTVVDRAIELQLVGGMSTNFLVNNYVTMETSEGTTEIGYLTNIRSVNYSGNAGLGMIYHMHKQISLRLEPRFRYFLNSVNDATLPTTRPYTFGLFTGLSYTF